MTARAKNVWEAEGRARKTAALVRAIESDLRGVREQTGGQLIAEYLRTRDPQWWEDLSRLHGIRKPSALTIEAVCLEFDARAIDDTEPTDEPTPADLAEIARMG